MIRLSNGHIMEHVVGSGALAFDGKGWFWEWPLVWAGLIKPELFTVVIKTLTLKPRPGNLHWHKPWNCMRLITGGSVNKIGLTNPGIHWWCKKVGPHLNRKVPISGSIFGTKDELKQMADMLNYFDLIALEVNPSCPNTGHAMQTTEDVVACVKAVSHISRHPVIVKVSVAQDYLNIAHGLKGFAQAISLNSVPWEMVFPGKQSPLHELEKRVSGGGGGVSGTPAQSFNWKAVRELAKQGDLPVIGPSVMNCTDVKKVREAGAKAVSYGAIHLRTPWRPTMIAGKETL